MKKLISLIFTAMFVFPLLAQTNVATTTAIDYYGIDYSIGKVFGAKESPAKFQKIFNAINELVVHESSKYNVGKFFKKKDVETLLDVTLSNNNAIDSAVICTTNSNYKLTDEQLALLVKSYNIVPKHSVGMVIVSELLNKSSNKGNYYVVFFDTNSKEILFSKFVSGKAGGFGLRNFWAGSIYDIMNSWKYPKA